MSTTDAVRAVLASEPRITDVALGLRVGLSRGRAGAIRRQLERDGTLTPRTRPAQAWAGRQYGAPLPGPIDDRFGRVDPDEVRVMLRVATAGMPIGLVDREAIRALWKTPKVGAIVASLLVRARTAQDNP